MKETVSRLGSEISRHGVPVDRQVPVFNYEIRNAFSEIISGLRRIDTSNLDHGTQLRMAEVMVSGEKLSRLVGEAVLGLVGSNEFSKAMTDSCAVGEARSGRVLSGVVGKSLAEIERIAIEETIAQNGGSVPKAARVLGVSPSTLYRKREGWMQIAAE